MKRIRVGNGSGFWGDNVDAPVELARSGELDYLTLEYLAELTMSILALQKQRDPEAGYARDFLDVLPRLQGHPRLKVITNAGGMSPLACARRAKEAWPDAAIAAVVGDDLMPRLDELIASGHPFKNLDTGEVLSTVRSRVVSANAYLGSEPIAEALGMGACVVVTGRVADACLTVGPALYELGWSARDWGRVASATVAGHLIECGAQATGGLWCNWTEADLAEVGYPIVEIAEDGSLILTKPPGSGGAVNLETATEQLLYEVADPAAYYTPDVIADFTSVTMTQSAPDVVAVTPARGRPAPDTLKVSIAYRDGWASSGTLVIAGPRAAEKARACAEMVRRRLQRAEALPQAFYVECLGAGDSLPGVLPPCDAPEVVMRLAVKDPRKAVVERFGREIVPLVTSGPPGVTGYTTGRPSPREVFAYWPALVARDVVKPIVTLV
jgi:hypothetical protein